MTTTCFQNRGFNAAIAGALAGLLWYTAVPLQAVEPMTRFTSQPGSKVSVKGSCDLHWYNVQGNEVQGEVELGADFHTMNTPSVGLGKIPARIEGFIPVRSLHYNSSGAMDRALYSFLKAETNPRILFRLRALSLKAGPHTNGAPYVLDSQCELVVAGVTNEVAMPIHLLPLGDGKLKITGNVSAKMSDFGIEPPKLPLTKREGPPLAIKYRDEIDLSFEWLVARQPASSLKDEP
jgi:hypothetical protein